MSFIFQDKNLLNSLFKISQRLDQDLTQDQTLKKINDEVSKTALQLVDGLRQEMSSPIEIKSGPTLNDLKDLQSFSSWLMTSGATFKTNAGPVLISTTDSSNNSNLNISGAAAILKLLDDKSKKDPIYNEAVKNIIHILNTKLNSQQQINLNKPEEKSQTEKQNQSQPQPQPQPQNQSQITNEISKTLSSSQLLDGKIVNMDDIYSNAKTILSSLEKGKDKGDRNYIDGITRIEALVSGGIKNLYDQLTPLTNKLNNKDLTLSPNESGAGGVLESANKYPNGCTTTELAKIARLLSSAMSTVKTFYTILSSIYSLQIFKDASINQIDMAERYQSNFNIAANGLDIAASKQH